MNDKQLRKEFEEALELINHMTSIEVKFDSGESKKRSDHNSLFLEALGAVLDDVKDLMKEYIENRIEYEKLEK